MRIPAPGEGKVFRRITFGPGNAFANHATYFDKDGDGAWREGATLGTTGSANTFSQVPGQDGYYLLDGAFRAGPDTIHYQDVVKCEIVAGKLEFTNAHVLAGVSSTPQGSWRSILDSSSITFSIDKLLFSFTITPNGKFISHYSKDTLDVVVSSGSLTIAESSATDPVTVGYHIANGKLILDRTDTRLVLRRKSG